MPTKMNLTDEIDDADTFWTTSTTDPVLANLRALDNSLRCFICKELYAVPVILKSCGHSFCSLCLLSSLKHQVEHCGTKRRAECPSCRVAANERDVVANRAVEEAVRCFRGVRAGLRDRLVGDNNASAAAGGGGGRAGMSTTSSGKRSAADNEGSNDDDDDDDDDANNTTTEGRGKRPRRSPRTAGTGALKKDNADDSSSNEEEEEEEEEQGYDSDVEFVEPNASAPSATTSASTSAAAAAASSSATPAPTIPMKPLPAPHLNKIQRKNLVSLLGQHGLSAKGSPDELKNRYRNFRLLYNSQCNSDSPMSICDMVKRIHSEERARREEDTKALMNGTSNHAACIKKINSRLEENAKKKSGKGGGGGGCGGPISTSQLSSGNAKFDTELKNNFKKLIAEGRAKLEEKKKKIGGSDSSESENKSSGGSGAWQEDGASAAAAAAAAASRDGDDIAGTRTGTNTEPEDDRKPKASDDGKNESTAASSSSLPPPAAFAADHQESAASMDTTEASRGNEPRSSPRTVSASSSSDAFADVSKSPSSDTSRSPSAAPARREGKGKGAGVQSSLLASAASATPRQQQQQQQQQQESFVEARSPVNLAPSTIGPWTCRKCTYINEINIESRATCEMCAEARPTSRPGSGRKKQDVISIDC